jgi:hypothetical protein
MNKRLRESVDEHNENDQEWREVVDTCDEMLLDEDYIFASDTIQGIRDNIEESKRVTPNQKRAIDNIKESVESRR